MEGNIMGEVDDAVPIKVKVFTLRQLGENELPKKKANKVKRLNSLL